MKDFWGYKADIKKCSKCGLCMAVCPVYIETKNDCANARGILSMLNGIIEGNLEPDDTLKKYLKLCTKCDKCKNFCPSDIDIPNIFKSAEEYFF